MSGQRLGYAAPGTSQEASSKSQRLGSLAVLRNVAFVYLLTGGFSWGVLLRSLLSFRELQTQILLC